MVLSHSKEPRRRILGHVCLAPRLCRREERGLHGILDQLEVVHPKTPREQGHQAAVLMPEEMLPERERHPGERISITSTPEPGRMSPGHSRATRMASSKSAAETIM